MIRTIGPKVDLAGLIADAIAEGREVHVVEATETKQGTLEAFAEALDFPGWFGHNLDALADCLDHLAEHATQPWELIVDHLAALRAADDPAYTGLHLVLADLTLRHPSIQVTLLAR